MLANARNATTSYGYDDANELTSISDALSGTVGFGYDDDGQQTSLTNPNGKTTTTTYDTLGNVLTTTDPLDRTTTNSYDLLGELNSTIDANDTTVGYAYDANGNLTSINSPDGTVSYAFDALNRQTSMTDPTGTTTWTYDADSQTTQVASPEGTIGYGYDAAGEQTSETLPGSRTVGYGYDASGNLTSLTDWQSQQTTFGYDTDGEPTSITRPNGVSTDTTYDADGEITDIQHQTTSSTLQSFSYAYDDAGNRISVLTAAGTESYTFDLLNRLTEVDYPNGDVVTYTYDANGNRLTQTVNGSTSTATYDAADELTDLDGTSYTYDADGNLTAAGSDTYSWDANNQLSSATVNSTTSDYSYDGNGNRVSATTGGTTTNYLWDGSSGLPSLVSDGTDTYLYADGGLQSATDASGTTSYALDDALGSVRGLTDASGNVIGTTDYDAFGAVRAQTGSSVALGYTGELTDPTTGFVDLRARDLDPALGRFLSADTVSPNAPGSQGYNLYAYVANNPTTWTDPSGQSIISGALPLVDACLETPSCAAPIEVGAEDVAEGGLIGIGGVPIIVFALLICALDVTVQLKTGHSLLYGCFGLALVFQGIMDRFGSSSSQGGYSGSVQDLAASPLTYPTHPAVADPATQAKIADFIYKAEWRDTDTGERVRVRKLSPKEVKQRGLETEKAAVGGSATDDIYEEVNPRQGTRVRRLWLGRGNGPLQSFDIP